MQRLYNSNAFETQYLVRPPLFINTARALLDKTSCLFISSPQEQARLFERHSKLSKLDDRCLLCYSLSRWSHTTSAMLSSRANSWLTWHSVSGLCWIFFFSILKDMTFRYSSAVFLCLPFLLSSFLRFLKDTVHKFFGNQLVDSEILLYACQFLMFDIWHSVKEIGTEIGKYRGTILCVFVCDSFA